MKKWICLILCCGGLTACTRYQPPAEITTEITIINTEPVTEAIPEITQPDLEVAPAEKAVEIQMEKKKEPVKVKGIYLSAFAAGTESILAPLLEEIEKSEINTVVIDVKDDNGHVTFDMNIPQLQEVGSCKAYIPDISLLLERLKEKNLYVIARVVAFRDPFLAEIKPEWSLLLEDQSLYRDKKGMAWINPYKREVWDYLIAISEQAATVGFDEIQFDYVRFSTEKGMNQVVFQEQDTQGQSKTEVISEFIAYATERLSQEIYVSADVFGTIIGSPVDADSVGQVYAEMAVKLDYISPMIYPSHYADGNFGLAHPDLYPYETILGALEKSKEDLAPLAENCAVVRPWLQDFTASYLKNYQKYGPDQVRQQIQAVYDAGYEEWILWNASCQYSWDGLSAAED